MLAGDTVSWEIEVVNRGPSADTDIVVVDDLSGLPVSAVGAVGPG